LWQTHRLENTRCGANIPVLAISFVKSRRSIARTIVSAVMLVLFAYGAGRFSDGPTGTCASGYCSTRHPHLPHIQRLGFIERLLAKLRNE
jgi:hypothetical protein